MARGKSYYRKKDARAARAAANSTGSGNAQESSQAAAAQYTTSAAIENAASEVTVFSLDGEVVSCCCYDTLLQFANIQRRRMIRQARAELLKMSAVTMMEVSAVAPLLYIA